MSKYWLLFVSFFVFACGAYADQSDFLILQPRLASSVYEDVRETSFHAFNLETWRLSWPFLVALTGIYFNDERIDRNLKKIFPPDYSTHNWDQYLYLAWGGMYVLGREHDKKAAIELLEALADTEIMINSMKKMFSRVRPNLDKGAYIFEGPFGADSNYNSFPSFHACWVYSWATILSREYNQPLLYYGIATYYMYTKPYEHNHWMSDLVFSTVMGIYLGNIVLDRANSSLKNKGSNEWSVLPLFDEDKIGIAISKNL
jgi:membrane-associated phospholipid phosphatase